MVKFAFSKTEYLELKEEHKASQVTPTCITI